MDNELTAREKIQKYAKVEKRPDRFGDTLICGGKKLNMSKRLDQMTDGECARVAGMLKINDFIARHVEVVAKAKAKRPAAPVAEPGLCECLCGGRARGRKSHFIQGHDAKHHSALRKAAEAGSAEAKKELKDRGWS